MFPATEPRTPASTDRPSAALVVIDGGVRRIYRAFDAVAHDPRGLALFSDHLLELDEEVDLELGLPGGTLDARVRVVEILTQPAGMIVAVLGDRTLTDRIAAAFVAT